MRAWHPLLLLAVVGCSEDWAVGPGEPIAELQLLSAKKSAGIPPAQPELGSAAGQIILRATINTADVCQDLRARLARRSEDLQVTVTARGKRGQCGQLLAELTYELVIGDLPSGSYRVQLKHAEVTRQGQPVYGPQEVLTSSVMVP